MCCNVFPSTSSAGALGCRCCNEATKDGLLPVSGFRPSSRKVRWADAYFFHPLAQAEPRITGFTAL